MGPVSRRDLHRYAPRTGEEMNVPISRLRCVRRSRGGQGLVEYALILVLVVSVLVTALSTIGRRNPGGNPMETVAQTFDDTD